MPLQDSQFMGARSTVVFTSYGFLRWDHACPLGLRIAT